jgi:hypothetical protein
LQSFGGKTICISHAPPVQRFQAVIDLVTGYLCIQSLHVGRMLLLLLL